MGGERGAVARALAPLTTRSPKQACLVSSMGHPLGSPTFTCGLSAIVMQFSSLRQLRSSSIELSSEIPVLEGPNDTRAISLGLLSWLLLPACYLDILTAQPLPPRGDSLRRIRAWLMHPSSGKSRMRSCHPRDSIGHCVLSRCCAPRAR